MLAVGVVLEFELLLFNLGGDGSFRDETDTYSPAAMENAPAARPARPVSTIVFCASPPPPTPAMRDTLVTRPSMAPNTAGRSHPPETSRCWCMSASPGLGAPLPGAALSGVALSGVALSGAGPSGVMPSGASAWARELLADMKVCLAASCPVDEPSAGG